MADYIGIPVAPGSGEAAFHLHKIDCADVKRKGYDLTDSFTFDHEDFMQEIDVNDTKIFPCTGIEIQKGES